MKCKTRKPNQDILIALTRRRLQAIVACLQKLDAMNEVPLDEREAVDGVIRQIKNRLGRGA